MFKKSILIILLITLLGGALFPRVMQAYTGGSASIKAAQIEGLSPKVYQMAVNAHRTAALNGELQNKNIITIIDYTKPSYEKRLWVIRLSDNKVLYYTYVAHGEGSGNEYAKHFSNAPGSKTSSLGVFKTGGTYQGKHGTSMNIHGLEGGINSNAFARRVVVHGSNYVNQDRAKQKLVGRSHGCPAISYKEVGPIINATKGGSLLFIYYPDKSWLSQSKYV